MNATYLLLFTTNTNEGTKRNVQTTGPEKSNKKTSNTAEKLLPALEKIGSLSKKKIYTI